MGIPPLTEACPNCQFGAEETARSTAGHAIAAAENKALNPPHG
jgi:hypothetical protein